jgi:hypothetical protein
MFYLTDPSIAKFEFKRKVRKRFYSDTKPRREMCGRISKYFKNYPTLQLILPHCIET